MRLPSEASQRLPSRGQVAVQGAINGHEFRTVLEPDGVKGHWMKVPPELQHAAGVTAGDVVEPRHRGGSGLAGARRSTGPGSSAGRRPSADPGHVAGHHADGAVGVGALGLCDRTPVTRQRRVDVTISKMTSGKRRPCCFDLSACTDPAVSKNGKLRGAT